MKHVISLSLLFFLSTPSFCALPPLAFNDEVAYSHPSFYMLTLTSVILLGAILLFLGAMVALTRVGYYKNIGAKAQAILRRGFFALAGLMGLLFASIFMANQSLVDLLFLRDNAFVALSIVVLLELWVLGYAYTSIRLSAVSSHRISEEK